MMALDRSKYGSCGGCDAFFTGKQNHCTQCHLTFASEKGGDSHRVGPYDPPGARRCKRESELEAGGMWSVPNGAGTPVWHGRVSKSGKSQRKPVDPRLLTNGSPLTDE